MYRSIIKILNIGPCWFGIITFYCTQEPKSKRGRPAVVSKGRKGAVVVAKPNAKATPAKRKAPSPPGTNSYKIIQRLTTITISVIVLTPL